MRMAAFDPGRERGDQVGRYQQRSPTFVLADVDELVRDQIVVRVIDAQNDVAERDRPVVPPEPPGPAGLLAQQEAFVRATRAEEGSEQQADERPGPGPEIAEGSQSGMFDRTSVLSSVISCIA